jgi:hypothetical protein
VGTWAEAAPDKSAGGGACRYELYPCDSKSMCAEVAVRFSMMSGYSAEDYRERRSARPPVSSPSWSLPADRRISLELSDTLPVDTAAGQLMFGHSPLSGIASRRALTVDSRSAPRGAAAFFQKSQVSSTPPAIPSRGVAGTSNTPSQSPGVKKSEGNPAERGPKHSRPCRGVGIATSGTLRLTWSPG